eukprot:1158464-Pelagomonas_calceolata.AAC.4
MLNATTHGRLALHGLLLQHLMCSKMAQGVSGLVVLKATMIQDVIILELIPRRDVVDCLLKTPHLASDASSPCTSGHCFFFCFFPLVTTPSTLTCAPPCPACNPWMVPSTSNPVSSASAKYCNPDVTSPGSPPSPHDTPAAPLPCTPSLPSPELCSADGAPATAPEWHPDALSVLSK